MAVRNKYLVPFPRLVAYIIRVFSFFISFFNLQKNAALARRGLFFCSSSTTTTRLLAHRVPWHSLIHIHIVSPRQEENAAQETRREGEEDFAGPTK